jgi:segregation and condensation protein B
MPYDDEQHDEMPQGDETGTPVDEAVETPDAHAVQEHAPSESKQDDGAASPPVTGAEPGEAAVTAEQATAADQPQSIGSELPSGETSIDVVMAPDAEPAPALINDELVAILEAVVFASPEPITPRAIVKLLQSEAKEDVERALAELQRRYTQRAGGLQIVEVAGGYQIVTRPELHEWVRRMFHERTTQRLSVQALETLAVIAYKQPITAAEITEIRGVNTSGVIGTLLERSLVKISGRKQVVGRPFLYSTTREFLDRFGLKDLNDLPKVEDMAHALGFEPPAGLATEAPEPGLPLDEPATEEDEAVLTGGGDLESDDGESGHEPS